MNCNLCALINDELEGAVLNLGVVAAVVTNGDAGEIYNGILVVTSGAECDLAAFCDLGSLGKLNVCDVGLVPSRSVLCANIYCFNDDCRSIGGCEYVLSLGIHFNGFTVNENEKLTVICIEALNCNIGKCACDEDDLRVSAHLCAAGVILECTGNSHAGNAFENACNVALSSRTAEYVLAFRKRTFDRDLAEIVVIKTLVNNCAVLKEHHRVHFVKNDIVALAFFVKLKGSVCSICIRNNSYNCTGLNLEGDSTLDLDLATVVSYATGYGNSGVILNLFKTCGSCEIKNCVLCDFRTCVRILIGNLNGCALASVCECNKVFTCYCVINCACINCVIAGSESYNRIIRVVSLNCKTFVGKLVTNVVIYVHTAYLNLCKSRSCGSFFTGIDNNIVEIEVANGKNFYCCSLCEVNAESICGCTNAIDSEVVVSGIGCYRNKSSCCNVEGNERAGLHIESVCILVPSNVSVFSADVKAFPIECAALCNGSCCIEGVGCACCAGVLIEVVVCSVVNCNLGRVGIPRIKVRNLTVCCTEDGSKVSVESCFFSCEHSHTCNSLCDSACACVVILNELNCFISRMNTVHRDVSLVLVFSRIITVEGDVSADFGIDNCNCSVSAPGTTDSGLAFHNALVCCELTAIEDSTVNDSVGCALVRALESGKVTCCAAVVLGCIDYVNCTVLEVCCVVSTEDEVGITGNEYVLEILTACEELESILNTEKGRVLHNESVCLNEKCKTSFNTEICSIHSFLSVPVVRDGKALDCNAGSHISYCNCLCGVCCMSETTCIYKTVERIPLDCCLILTCAADGEVRNCNFKLFCEKTLADKEKLLFISINSCKEVKSLLYCCEHIVAVNNLTDSACVSLVNLCLICVANL